MGTIITTTTDAHAIVRLMSWLSPVFPTGGFAYSSGLEAAVQSGLVGNRADLKDWLEGLLEGGAIRNDAIFLGQAWRHSGDGVALERLAELALAMTGSAERHLETSAQAEAFGEAVTSWSELAGTVIPQPCTLPIAVGIAAGSCSIGLPQSVSAYLQSFITNQTQAAIRLSIIGQSAAAEILASMENRVLATARFAGQSTLDDLGSSTVMAEIAAMRHGQLSGRMFRT